MKNNRQKTSWVVDAALFAGFLLAFFLDLTGVLWHQWLGMAVGACAVYHLLAHWDWVKAVTHRFLGRTSKQARLYYVIDAGLLAGFLAIVSTGLVISTWADLTLDNYPVWKNVHVVASVLTMALIVSKIAVHWRWIVNVAERYVFKPSASKGGTRATSASAITGRREFVRLMGLVSLTAAVAACRVLDDIQAPQSGAAAAGQDTLTSSTPAESASNNPPSAAAAVQASSTPVAEPSPTAVVQETLETPTPVLTATATPTASATTTATAEPTPTVEASASPCVVRCQRSCAFPGRCRRYTDANNNDRCDLGECL